jgi:isocitrate/isopropylmalate dehydrogenase
MMRPACEIAKKAARHDGIDLVFEETPAGWNAMEQFGTTMPASSLKRIKELGVVVSGSVGDPRLDATLGKEHPEMMPERNTLLRIRRELGLNMNVRPVIYNEELKPLVTRLRLGKLPPGGIRQYWLRFLKECIYFGNDDLLPLVPPGLAALIGLKMKQDVTGDEERVVNFAYYSKTELEKYFRAAFTMARALQLPAIVVHKRNIIAHYVFFCKVAQRIHDTEFPDVPYKEQLIDSITAMLFMPELLNGVIICGNMEGDSVTDGANGVYGLGMMFSSAINTDTGEAMFESGAGTAADIAGQDRANPIGRIRTAGLMLEHIGIPNGAKDIEMTVYGVLRDGYRTSDIFSPNDDPGKLVGTAGMGGLILARL